MFLRMLYPPKQMHITAIVTENLYWKAADICKIVHYHSHVRDVLQRYIPGETLYRLSQIVPSMKNSNVWVLSSGQVLRFMVNIPDFRRDYIFDKWFISVIDGKQKFYPENANNFLKCLIPVSSLKFGSVDVKPVMEGVNNSPYEFNIPILFQERLKLKKSDVGTKQSSNESESPPVATPLPPSVATPQQQQQEEEVQQSMESAEVIEVNTNPENIITEPSTLSHNCVSSSSSSINSIGNVCDTAVSSSFHKSLMVDEDKSFNYSDPIYGGHYKYCAIEMNWNQNHLTPISVYPYMDKQAEKFYLYAPVKM